MVKITQLASITITEADYIMARWVVFGLLPNKKKEGV